MPRTKQEAEAILKNMTQDDKSRIINNIAALLKEKSPNKLLLRIITNPNTDSQLLDAACISLMMHADATWDAHSTQPSAGAVNAHVDIDGLNWACAEIKLKQMTADEKSHTIDNIAELLDENNPNRTLLETIANPDATPPQLLDDACIFIMIHAKSTWDAHSAQQSTGAASEFNEMGANLAVNAGADIDGLTTACEGIKAKQEEKDNILLTTWRGRGNAVTRGASRNFNAAFNVAANFLRVNTRRDFAEPKVEFNKLSQRDEGAQDFIIRANHPDSIENKWLQAAADRELRRSLESDINSIVRKKNDLKKQIMTDMNMGDVKIGKSWAKKTKVQERQDIISQISQILLNPDIDKDELTGKINSLIAKEKERLEDSRWSSSKKRHRTNIDILKKMEGKVELVQAAKQKIKECDNYLDNEVFKLQGDIENGPDTQSGQVTGKLNSLSKELNSLSKELNSCNQKLTKFTLPTKPGESTDHPDRSLRLSGVSSQLATPYSEGPISVIKGKKFDYGAFAKLNFDGPEQRNMTARELQCSFNNRNGNINKLHNLDENAEAKGHNDETMSKQDFIAKVVELYTSTEEQSLTDGSLSRIMFGPTLETAETAIQMLINSETITSERLKTAATHLPALNNPNHQSTREKLINAAAEKRQSPSATL